MKALSLTQPWATLIAIGAKEIETRSWSTGYRGLVAIHASKGFPKAAKQICLQEPFRSTLLASGLPRLSWVGGTPSDYPDPATLPLGAIVAVCNLVWCFRFTHSHTYPMPFRKYTVRLEEPELSFGDFAPGRYGLYLEHVRPLAEPVPCRGALGLWEVPADVEARIVEQVSG